MKVINFLETVPQKERRSVQRWWQISLLLIGVIICAILFMQTVQLFSYYKTYKQYRSSRSKEIEYSKLIGKLAQLQAQEKTLQETTAKSADYKAQAQKMVARLKALQNIASDVALQTFEYSFHNTQITVVAATTEKAFNAVQNLNKETAFNFLTLSSMQPKDKSYIFTIRQS